MKTTNKPYQLQYKKKTATTDTYLPRGAGRTSVCRDCGSLYRNKRWYAGESLNEEAKKSAQASTVCPACLKIRDNYPGGIVTLKGAYVVNHKQELMNLIRNEEARARGFNPLERVISLRQNGSGTLVISTTNEKLAQRLGRAVQKAFHGDVAYHWSHDNKLVRVDWERAA